MRDAIYGPRGSDTCNVLLGGFRNLLVCDREREFKNGQNIVTILWIAHTLKCAIGICVRT